MVTLGEAFEKMCCQDDLSKELFSSTATFICPAYCPKGIHITSIPEFRWYLFCKYRTESEKLPSTSEALNQHIKRAHLQSWVWGQAAIFDHVLLDPTEDGYHRDRSGELQPTTTDLNSAPEAVLELATCGCKTDCSKGWCSCYAEKMPCTDMCKCSEFSENDGDSQRVNPQSDEDSD